MEIINLIIKSILHPQEILETIPKLYSYILLFLIIFAESGFLFGFFLSGDSLLFIAGFLASVMHSQTNAPILDIWVILPLMVVAAILGDNLGYYTGHKYGKKLFEREDSIIFKKRYLQAAQKYYDKRGHTAIILARFIPAVRTFAPIVAGMVGMDRKVFMKYNFIGGLLWVLSITLLGYFAGGTLKANGIDIEKYILPVVIIIVIISFVMAYFESKHLKHENIDVPEFTV